MGSVSTGKCEHIFAVFFPSLCVCTKRVAHTCGELSSLIHKCERTHPFRRGFWGWGCVQPLSLQRTRHKRCGLTVVVHDFRPRVFEHNTQVLEEYRCGLAFFQPTPPHHHHQQQQCDNTKVLFHYKYYAKHKSHTHTHFMLHLQHFRTKQFRTEFRGPILQKAGIHGSHLFACAKTQNENPSVHARQRIARIARIGTRTCGNQIHANEHM